MKSLASLKKDLWKVFAAWVKQEENNQCYTCGKICYGKDCHAGHFIKASVCGIELYFHENNVHVQCSYCNLWLDGNQYEYGIRLGKKIVAKLRKIRAETKGTQWNRRQYEEKIEKYKRAVR